MDEAGIGLLPSVRRTYALKGKTPIIKHTCRYKHLSLVSAICARGKIFWQHQTVAFNGKAIVRFLKQLLEFAKRKITVIWDGAKIHNSQEVKDFLNTLKSDKIWLVCIPPYSPELNADEQVWNYLKSVLLKNTCAHNIKELESNVQYAMSLIEEDKKLIRSFFKHKCVAYY